MRDYQLIRSGRKTLSIEITPELDLLVRAPRWMKTKQIEAFLAEKEEWIEGAFARVSKRAPVTARPFTRAEVNALKVKARAILPQKVAFLAEKMGITYRRVSIRAQVTRFGSCSATGVLNLNCILALFPDDVVEYVLIHELCHRIEMNHSGAFWTKVEQFCPDWRKKREWLRKEGSAVAERLRDVKEDEENDD